MKIWRLESKIEPNYLCIRSSLELTYFYSYFIGESLPNDWVSPSYEVLRKSKKLPDYVSWNTGAPLVTERFVNVMNDLIGNHVQFLPFDIIKGKKTFAMNVIHIEKDILDTDNSNISYADEEKKYCTGVNKAIFTNLPEKIPPIFKLERKFGRDIFVNEEFCKLVVEHQLTGISLADPAVDSFKLVVKALNTNVYPGVAD